MPYKKRVFALLVGINDYPEPVSALKGCEPDTKAILAYLKSIDDIEVNEKTLLGAEATKEAIVHQFLNHLGQAGEKDVAFFFFAGHGTREEAHEVFWPSTTDKKLQSLVCYDGVTLENNKEKYNLLSNKELRFLIHKISKNNAHILSVFDCCHSGEITRETLLPRIFKNSRSSDKTCPLRPWSNFIFAEEIPKETLHQIDIEEKLPEGRHIHLSACSKDELAYESGSGGIFTKNFIEILRRSENNITYSDLSSRIRIYLKNNFKQTPQVYTSGEMPNEVFRFFLDRSASKGSPVYGRITFKEVEGWVMDLGHMHGVSRLAEKVRVLTHKEDEQFEAEILTVEADQTSLKFHGREPNKEGIYKGFIEGFLSCPIKVFIKPATDISAQTITLFEKAMSKGAKNRYLATAEYEADYTLHLRDGGAIITFAEDDNRPLVAKVEPLNTVGANLVASYFNHISQWEFVKNLHNPNSYLYKRPPIKVEFFQLDETGKEELVTIKDGQVLLDYNMRIKGRLGGGIKIRLTNQYHKKLYVSFLYLSMNFRVYSKLLPKPVIGLNVGDESWARNGKPIILTYERQVERDNWKESITYFKLIIKESPFEAGMFDQGPLPSPIPEEKTRGGREEVEESNNSDDEWTTRLFALRIRNPNYIPK